LDFTKIIGSSLQIGDNPQNGIRYAIKSIEKHNVEEEIKNVREVVSFISVYTAYYLLNIFKEP